MIGRVAVPIRLASPLEATSCRRQCGITIDPAIGFVQACVHDSQVAKNGGKERRRRAAAFVLQYGFF